MDMELLKKARATLTDITPMKSDCGKYCNSACCSPDEDGNGDVLLFPGEEKLITGDWASIRPDGDGHYLLRCNGICPREMRPLGCMIFPLTPETDRSGDILMRFDLRARPLCPLIQNGLMGIRRDFRNQALLAMRLIAEDPEGLTFLRYWQETESRYRFTL